MLNQSKETLEILALYAQIIAPILATLAIVVSWIIYIGQKQKEQRAKAIEIGMEVEPIMHLIAYIDSNFRMESEELISILSKADKSKMKLFEYDEIKNVYSTEDLKILKKYFPESGDDQKRIGGPGVKPKISVETLIQTREQYYSLFSIPLSAIEKDNREDILIHEFRQIIIDVFNRLETLCLKMIKKVADEKAIYHAMQPSFLKFVSFFYYYIAYTNRNVIGDDKKLKHVIRIFNKWRKRYERNSNIQKVKNRISIFIHQ